MPIYTSILTIESDPNTFSGIRFIVVIAGGKTGSDCGWDFAPAYRMYYWYWFMFVFGVPDPHHCPWLSTESSFFANHQFGFQNHHKVSYVESSAVNQWFLQIYPIKQMCWNCNTDTYTIYSNNTPIDIGSVEYFWRHLKYSIEEKTLWQLMRVSIGRNFVSDGKREGNVRMCFTNRKHA